MVKKLAQLHLLLFLVAGMLMTTFPVFVHFVAWSVVIWMLGYPLYFISGEPWWD